MLLLHYMFILRLALDSNMILKLVIFCFGMVTFLAAVYKKKPLLISLEADGLYRGSSVIK